MSQIFTGILIVKKKKKTTVYVKFRFYHLVFLFAKFDNPI